MIALVLVLTLIALSVLVTRLVTKALVLTGMSEEVARFQARSVFTGAGYTTQESETIVNHPVRRRIIMWLMVVQNAGLVTVITMLVASFVGTGTVGDVFQRGAVLVGGLALLILLSRSETVDAALERLIDWALKTFSDLHVRDYYTMLHLEADYAVQRLGISEDGRFANKKLKDLDLVERGILVLSLERDGEFMGAPGGDVEVKPGDRLTLYGEMSGFEELAKQLPDGEPPSESEAVSAQTGKGLPGDD